jgi:dihydroorotase
LIVHCEDETTIKNNLAKYTAEYGEDIPVTAPLIRSEEACISSKAVALAKKTGARLHVFTFRLPKRWTCLPIKFL